MPDEQNLEAQQQEDNQRPDWLPENFKTPEDLANSYKELQGEFTRTRQQTKEYEQRLSQLEEMVAASQQEEEPAQQPNFLQASQDQLYAAYENDPLATMAWLAQESAKAVLQKSSQDNQPDPRQLEAQAQMAGQFAENAIKARYTDWDTHREHVAEEIQNNPDLYPEDLFQTPAGIEKALDRAYKAVKLTALESESDKSLEERIAEQRLAKQQAQTLSGQTGRPAPVDDWESRWEEIKNAPSRSYSDLMGPQR